MTSLTRRSFFKLVAGGACVAVSIPYALRAAVPVIYCDGVNCDAAGLNALIKGDTVEFAVAEMDRNIKWIGDVLHLGGDFTIHEPLEINGDFSNKTISGGSFQGNSDCAVILNGAKYITFVGMAFTEFNTCFMVMPTPLNAKKAAHPEGQAADRMKNVSFDTLDFRTSPYYLPQMRQAPGITPRWIRGE